MHSLTIVFFFILGVAHVYSSVIPLTSGAIAAGPLGGAGPTVVAGPSGTVASTGVAHAGLGLGLGLGGWGGWGGVIAGPTVWGAGLHGGWW